MANDDQTIDRQGRVTLHDVAAAAGVSKSTVSRILDERLPRSESETARKVRRVADELGYMRDVSAANLRRGSTGTIGVIVPRLTNMVMAMLYEAVAHACARRGQFAFVVTTDDEPEAERAAARTLVQRGVDGLILSTTRDGDLVPGELAERGVPFVLALRTDGINASSVGDDAFGGWIATRHLVDLGHRRIGIIAGPAYASSARGRLDGYRRALAEAGLPFDPALVVHSTFGIDSGAEAIEVLMGRDPRPTAVFTVNDNIAIGALSRLAQMGIAVPQDVSIVGYNDIPIVSRLSAPLTSVRVPFDQIATSALDLLAEGAGTGGERIRRATPTLVPRRSTARPHDAA